MDSDNNLHKLNIQRLVKDASITKVVKGLAKKPQLKSTQKSVGRQLRSGYKPSIPELSPEVKKSLYAVLGATGTGLGWKAFNSGKDTIENSNSSNRETLDDIYAELDRLDSADGL